MTISAAKMKRAISEIKETDPKFAAIIDAHPLCTIGRKASDESHFESIVSSVISQQLATKAAVTIHGRLVALSGGKITPNNIVKLRSEDLRAAGVSGAKVKTIQGLGRAALNGEVAIDELHLIDDDEVLAKQLNSLWGIGPWTVDMFMMFQLGRLDIWPVGDLGVRRGWEKIHQLKENIEPKQLQKRGEKFRPHRSIVAWYCWRAIENK
jgi:DNA-3-methyladenine glycosylase II